MNVTSHKPHIYLFRKISDSSIVYVGQQGGDQNKDKSAWRTYITGGTVLNQNLKAWGSEKFWRTYSKEIIETIETLHRLNVLETLYIGYYDTYNNGYNLTPQGGTTRGYRHSEEWRRESRQRNGGKNNPRYGQIVSEQTRAKQRASTTGRKCTLQQIEANRQRNLGQKNGFFGKTHTKEILDKNRQSHIRYLVYTPFGGPYKGYVEANIQTGINLHTIRYRCNSSSQHFENWYFEKYK